MNQCLIEKTRSRRLTVLRQIRCNRAADVLSSSDEFLEMGQRNISASQDRSIAELNVIYKPIQGQSALMRAG